MARRAPLFIDPPGYATAPIRLLIVLMIAKSATCTAKRTFVSSAAVNSHFARASIHVKSESLREVPMSRFDDV